MDSWMAMSRSGSRKIRSRRKSMIVRRMMIISIIRTRRESKKFGSQSGSRIIRRRRERRIREAGGDVRLSGALGKVGTSTAGG